VTNDKILNLKEKIRELPSNPGVYLMKDSLDTVIYVGKSKNLKNRVSSYFTNSKSHPPKVVKLVKNLKDFDYILTDTEFEAFMLECRLIREIKPIYNKQMKSPKSYSYIKIKINEKYPDIELTNEYNKSDENLYFGPYTNKNTVEKAIQGIKECCKILCSNSSRKSSYCLNYSLGLCIGMCLDKTPSDQYLDIIKRIANLLNGTDTDIIKTMENIMNKASEELDFETAAKYRDYLTAVNYIISKGKVIEYTEDNKNIAIIETISDHMIKFFLIKGNRLLFSASYTLGNLQDLKGILKDNISCHFNKSSNNSIEIGRDEIDEAQIIYSYINNKTNNCKHIIIPEKWLLDANYTYLDETLNEMVPGT